jgi:hypothetical protein
MQLVGGGVLALAGLIGELGLHACQQELPYCQFKPHCILENEELPDDPAALEGRSDLLTRHAVAHGWRHRLDQPDLVLVAPSAGCPENELDEICAAIARNGTSGGGAWPTPELAQILERNGRLEAAFSLLDAALHRNRSEDRSSVRARLAEWAAYLAAHAQRWELALDYAEDWKPDPGCGTCEGQQKRRKLLLSARCLMALDRRGEVAQLARASLESEFTVDAELIGMWIDCELAARPAAGADDALEAVLAQVSERERGFCELAFDVWTWSRAPRSGQIAQLRELAAWRPELALSLLQTLSRSEIQSQLRVLEELEGKPSPLEHGRSALARLLADLGFPEVGPALARAREQAQDMELRARLEDLEAAWKVGNARWETLTQGFR